MKSYQPWVHSLEFEVLKRQNLVATKTHSQPLTNTKDTFNGAVGTAKLNI